MLHYTKSAGKTHTHLIIQELFLGVKRETHDSHCKLKGSRPGGSTRRKLSVDGRVHFVNSECIPANEANGVT